MNIRNLVAGTIAIALASALPAFAHSSSPATQDSPNSTATPVRFHGVTPGHPAIPASSSVYCVVESPPYHHHFKYTCPIYGSAVLGAPCSCPSPANGFPGVVKAVQ